MRVAKDLSDPDDKKMVRVGKNFKPEEISVISQTETKKPVKAIKQLNSGRMSLSSKLISAITTDKTNQPNHIPQSVLPINETPEESYDINASSPLDEDNKAYINYGETILQLTYVVYIRFPDGTTSLLKNSKDWELAPEPPIRLSLHLEEKEARLDRSLNLSAIIRNNLARPLDLNVDQDSFKFRYSLDDNFGALMPENKLSRNIYLPAISQDTLVFSFVPIKSGPVELQEIILHEQNTNKDIVFSCNFKIFVQ